MNLTHTECPERTITKQRIKIYLYNATIEAGRIEIDRLSVGDVAVVAILFKARNRERVY